MLYNINYDDEPSEKTSATNILLNVINNNITNIQQITMSTDVKLDSGSLGANNNTLECV
jgi:hypothetical protein